MNHSLLLFSLGPTEIFLIVFVILLLFGAKRIPDLAKGLGKGIREFKEASKGETSEEKDDQKKS
jgi:sec-independent protein translocase protein TatA